MSSQTRFSTRPRCEAVLSPEGLLWEWKSAEIQPGVSNARGRSTRTRRPRLSSGTVTRARSYSGPRLTRRSYARPRGSSNTSSPSGVYRRLRTPRAAESGPQSGRSPAESVTAIFAGTGRPPEVTETGTSPKCSDTERFRSRTPVSAGGSTSTGKPGTG